MENKAESFNYTYSAKEQNEIKNIRDKYVPPEQQEDKMSQLRRLDKIPSSKATVCSLILGIVGTLLLGTGMSLIMTDIGKTLGIANPLPFGIPVGIIGLALVCLAYPVYNRVLKKEREKIAPEILRLTDELMK